jgi:hypothetical protein
VLHGPAVKGLAPIDEDEWQDIVKVPKEREGARDDVTKRT